MDDSTLVPQTTTSSVCSAVPASETQVGVATSSGQRSDTPTEQDAATDWLSVVRQSLYSKDIPADAAEIILAGWRVSTQRQYKVYIDQWVRFCHRRQVDLFQPTVKVVISFLSELFQRGAGYSTINTARSALSTFVFLHDVPVGQHPLVKQFLKGCFNLRPALPKYEVTWDVEVLLKHLRSLSPVKYLNLMKLSCKLVTLLALLTGQRGQTLHLIDIRNVRLSQSKISFTLGDLLKHSRPGKHQAEISVKAYAPDRRLCVVTVMREYLKRTSVLRKAGNTRLFIGTIAPHSPISRDTLSRWMKLTMQAAGIDVSVFSPHSVRAAATSAAYKAYVPLETILRTAGWARESTFRKYYKKPAVSEQFGNSVLESAK